MAVWPSFAVWSWDRTVEKVPYRTAGNLTEIATAPRAPRIIARELPGERELERALACLGDLVQLHTGEFLVQRTLKGGSSLGVFDSPRVCLT